MKAEWHHHGCPPGAGKVPAHLHVAFLSGVCELGKA